MKEELRIDIVGLAGACSYALDCIEARMDNNPILKLLFRNVESTQMIRAKSSSKDKLQLQTNDWKQIQEYFNEY